MSAEPQSPRARRLTAASLVPSAIGIVLLVWWFVDGARAWWMLAAGAAAAIVGAAIAARARREPATEGEERDRGSSDDWT